MKPGKPRPKPGKGQLKKYILPEARRGINIETEGKGITYGRERIIVKDIIVWRKYCPLHIADGN